MVLKEQLIGINVNQIHPKTSVQNKYLNHLVDLSFQGVNRLFALSFENQDDRRSHSSYYVQNVKIKNLQCHDWL